MELYVTMSTFSLLTQILCTHSDYFGIRVQEWLIPVASAEKMIVFVNGWSQAKKKTWMAW